MLSIFTLLMPGAFRRVKLRGSHLLAALLLGVYAYSISYGYAFIPVAAGALIFFTFVVVSMTLFSVLIEGERLTLSMIFGQLLGLAGVSLITSSGVSSITPIGALLMASTWVSLGTYSVYGRRFENSFGYTYNSFLLFGVASSAMFLGAYHFTGGSLLVSVSRVSLVMALFMGMVSTALSYVLWQRVMKRIRASQGGISQLLVPILTSVIGVLVLGEEVTPLLIIGGFLVLTGIFLCILRSTIGFNELFK
jgi:drug/metabolite transporter (DMT)-like permease